MKRLALQSLIHWKSKASRKPLIVRGARQVGKTWLMKHFGELHFEQTVYLNFERQPHLKGLFDQSMNPQDLIRAIETDSNASITPGRTLLIFDEIQECPKAITALKYFYEEAADYHILAAGSLLGVALHQSVSFPVGKVSFLDLHPMNFEEFLLALGHDQLCEALNRLNYPLLTALHDKLSRLLRSYYVVGGMPEAVLHFAASERFDEVREIQQALLLTYEQDFSTHAPAAVVSRIRMVWNSVLSQLAQERRKFVYAHIKEGARAKDFEMALAWLTDCGQVRKVHAITKPHLPLKAYEDLSAFKLFLHDVGLLGAMGNLPVKTLLQGSTVFTEFKGALTEQFVCQELTAVPDLSLYYWSAKKGAAEVDFVVQKEEDIIPVEVKAEENLKAKSLLVYQERYQPRIALRTSLSVHKTSDWLHNIPLYAIGFRFK
ncbi:MAG: ATP-binding protein [Candidatus Cyclonatronum sp.]|uniref:ATP-binding protein n=1 Tax=Cyclonatronum sp. TaxID=3024185 RepID=UPI0025C1A4F6|nr:ATP-binding protein [Cyclonatronum sp.]MCH8486813.1 ATP-binding protein [Cyclonatronum sp.]